MTCLLERPTVRTTLPKLLCVFVVWLFIVIWLMHDSCEHASRGGIYLMICGNRVQFTINGTKTNLLANETGDLTQFLRNCTSCIANKCSHYQWPHNSTCAYIASFTRTYLCFARNTTLLFAEIYGTNVTANELYDFTILLEHIY